MERLDHILARLPLQGPGPIQLQRIEAALRELLGEDALRGVRIVGVRSGRVTLEASSAARAFELQAFHKAALERSLRGIEGLVGLTEIKVRVGG